MLVLQRKPGETITIGDDVVVTVLEVRSHFSVKLGFEAPKDVKIFRTELLEGKNDEKSSLS